MECSMTLSMQKPVVLCLEDEEDFQSIYSEILGEDYQVLAAKSVDEAKTYLATTDVRLAIVDLRLVDKDPDDLSGFRFLDEVIFSNLFIDLPCIIVTALHDPDHMRVAFRDYKAADFFRKQQLSPQELIKFKATVDQTVQSTYPSRMLGETPRILVVEDDPEWASLLRESLEEEGCEVDVAPSYREAMEHLTAHQYHLATVDVRLSDVDPENASGFELLNTIRKIGLLVDTIIVSAHAVSQENAEKTIRAVTDLGALAVVRKQDFSPRLFRRRIRKLMSQILYINVDVANYSDQCTFKVGEPRDLIVSVQKTNPKHGLSRSITRPLLTGTFDLQIVVNPFDVSVRPGSTQMLTVIGDNSAEPVRFSIAPLLEGRIEVVVDILHRGIQLARIIVTCDAHA